MTFDPFHFLARNAKTKDMKGRFNKVKTLNKKQISYLVNLSTIGGGAALYTEWQILFPLNNDIPHYCPIQQILIITMSVIMLLVGLFAQEEENK